MERFDGNSGKEEESCSEDLGCRRKRGRKEEVRQHEGCLVVLPAAGDEVELASYVVLGRGKGDGDD